MSAAVKRIVKSIRTRHVVRCVVVGAFSVPLPAAANDFDAEKVLNEMNPEQQYSYLAGVVEGLAVARYMKDGKRLEGMNCIYGWFYQDEGTVETILTAFERYGSYTPGAVIDVLTKQKCGE